MASTEFANPSSSSSLTTAQKAQIEKNKQKAIQLRQSRVRKRHVGVDGSSEMGTKVSHANFEIDSGAGFFIEETNEIGVNSKAQKLEPVKITYQPGPVLEVDNLFCIECDKEFTDSFLFNKFEHPVCDRCRDEEKHPMITKTDAKTKFLLKDEDFDKREPELKFIVRKNPHNPRWGEMKLFLLCQVEKRAMEVWGSEKKLKEAMEEKSINREKSKQKKFNKKLKELRMAVRSSLYRKDLSGHKHEYGEEEYDEEEDTYSKECTTCGHVWTYEKM